MSRVGAGDEGGPEIRAPVIDGIRDQTSSAQSLSVHAGWTYDLEFDTTHRPDPAELAAHVLRLVARP